MLVLSFWTHSKFKCVNIYVTSEKGLPEVSWNEKKPGFYFQKIVEKNILEMLEPIVKAPFIYEALSFMGCSCGLFYGDWTKLEMDNSERKSNVQDFMAFLEKHKTENKLQLFSTQWTDFLAEYPQKTFYIEQFSFDEFDPEELVVYQIV